MSVITVARQFGAGGRTLGMKVAERLDYTLIDEQIVEMIAMEADVSPAWVDVIAEEAGTEGIVKRLIRRLGPFSRGYVETAMEDRPGYINGDLYISLLYKVIPVLAEQNNVVIVGRGGQYILADRPDTFHFVLTANIENRIAFMMQQYDLDRRRAQAVIEKQDKRRNVLYSYFGRTEYERHQLYHLSLNMNYLSMDDAVRLVCQLVGG